MGSRMPAVVQSGSQPLPPALQLVPQLQAPGSLETSLCFQPADSTSHPGELPACSSPSARHGQPLPSQPQRPRPPEGPQQRCRCRCHRCCRCRCRRSRPLRRLLSRPCRLTWPALAPLTRSQTTCWGLSWRSCAPMRPGACLLLVVASQLAACGGWVGGRRGGARAYRRSQCERCWAVMNRAACLTACSNFDLTAGHPMQPVSGAGQPALGAGVLVRPSCVAHLSALSVHAGAVRHVSRIS